MAKPKIIDEKDIPENIKKAVLERQNNMCAMDMSKHFLTFLKKDSKKPITNDNIIALCPVHAKSAMLI